MSGRRVASTAPSLSPTGGTRMDERLERCVSKGPRGRTAARGGGVGDVPPAFHFSVSSMSSSTCMSVSTTGKN